MKWNHLTFLCWVMKNRYVSNNIIVIYIPEDICILNLATIVSHRLLLGCIFPGMFQYNNALFMLYISVSCVGDL